MKLSEHSIVDALGDDERNALLAIAQDVQFKAGAQIYEQGADSDAVAIVVSGSVRVVRYSMEGRETVLAFLGPGDVIGEIGCLGALPRSATVEAATDLVLKTIRRSDLVALMNRQPAIAQGFIRVLCERLADTDIQVSALSALRMRGRLATALLQLAKRRGEKIKLGTRIPVAISQKELGVYAGLSRENTSRIFASWREEGLVTTDADNYMILKDVDRLTEISESED